MHDQTYQLVADIGGTNARFAMAPVKKIPQAGPLKFSEQELAQIRVLNIQQYRTIDQAIEDYLSGLEKDYARPVHAVMAIACPTDHDHIEMTNYSWSFNVSDVQRALKFDSLVFINDYNALANCVPHLDEQGATQIGEGQIVEGLPKVVFGPGTGLGLGGIAFAKDSRPVTLQTEGGHVQFAPVDELEIQILQVLNKKFDRVSAERLLSGSGLENLYLAMADIKGDARDPLTASDITRQALENKQSLCGEVLTRFCSMLGSFAGDAALMLGAKGGVYIGGGIVPRFTEFLTHSNFRQRFQSKGRMSSYVEQIPTYVITSKQPGLLGAAAVLNHKLNGG